jgi:predicted acyltransferase
MPDFSEAKPLSLPSRVFALDALRGIAILAMLLSGQLPFGEHALPSWMYHAQVPPPNHVWNGTLPGITWVDLVFPFFLFSMGAAFPLALTRRLEQGYSVCKVAIVIIERGILLAFFALYVDAIRPFVLSEHPSAAVYLMSLLGFALLFPILTRLPENWKPASHRSVRAIGWFGAILFLAFARYANGTGFSLGRSDIIIVVLANMALFGALGWLFTRNRLLVRLGILAVLCAFRLSNMPKPIPGWVHDLWAWSPAPWIYQLYYLQYFFIVIPGTIAGDLILSFLSEQGPLQPPQSDISGVVSEKGGLNSWSGWRYFSIGVLLFAMVLISLIGLKARWLLPTTLALFASCGIGWLLLRDPLNALERLYRRLFSWGIYWVVLGLCFEPFEGGIKKDKATLSYFFLTAGLAICVFMCFSIILDVCRRRGPMLQLLIDNGQNPMIAYAGINNLIIPLLALTGGERLLSSMAFSPWLGFLKGMIVTLLVAACVCMCSRNKIFWRT